VPQPNCITVSPVAGDRLIELEGPAPALVAGERTALNLSMRLSGIATATAELVARLDGTGGGSTGSQSGGRCAAAALGFLDHRSARGDPRFGGDHRRGTPPKPCSIGCSPASALANNLASFEFLTITR
jgi:hypothetical protein